MIITWFQKVYQYWKLEASFSSLSICLSVTISLECFDFEHKLNRVGRSTVQFFQNLNLAWYPELSHVPILMFSSQMCIPAYFRNVQHKIYFPKVLSAIFWWFLTLFIFLLNFQWIIIIPIIYHNREVHGLDSMVK